MSKSQRRLALVTGASAGLGAEFARQLAAAGRDVVLVARRLDRLEALARDLTQAHGIEAYPVRADLAQADAHRHVMDAVAARGRTVDILINNAGFTIPEAAGCVFVAQLESKSRVARISTTSQNTGTSQLPTGQGVG